MDLFNARKEFCMLKAVKRRKEKKLV